MAKVLLVSNHLAFRNSLVRILTANEYDVIEAKNAGDAIEKSLQETPDLVLLDDFEVLKTVNQNSIIRDIPVVMVTETPAVTGEQDAMRLGVNHYMTTPWREDILKLTVRVSLREREIRPGDGDEASTTSPDETPSEPEIFIRTGSLLLPLEQILGGGITLGSLTLIEGASAAGKSVLCQHLSYGALVDDHPVVYFASEHTPESLLTQMTSIGLEVSDYFQEEQLCIYPVNQPASDEGPETSLALLARQIEQISLPYTLIIVDAVTDLAETGDDKAIMSLFSTCKRLCQSGRTIIIVGSSYAFGESLLTRLRGLCHTHLSIHAEKLGRRLVKTLEVHKVDYTDQSSGNQMSFDIRPKTGITLIPISKARA